MNIREALLEEHSKQQTDRIIKYIATDQKKFDELVSLFLNDEYRVVQRAAWPLSYIIIAHPGLAKKHLKKIIQNLGKPGIHDAVKRNTVRFLQTIDIPESLQGTVMDTCFNYIADPGEAVAIKAFSLTILHNLSKIYPEISGELKSLIETQLPHQTAGFKSRAKKILQQMEKAQTSKA